MECRGSGNGEINWGKEEGASERQRTLIRVKMMAEKCECSGSETRLRRLKWAKKITGSETVSTSKHAQLMLLLIAEHLCRVARG